MKRECVFCPNPATTGEHLWSEWVSKLLGPKNRYNIRREMEDEVLHWKCVGLNETMPVLCEPCNNVWGSNLEAQMKDVVAEMVRHATPKMLSETDIKIIARFALMKSFVAEYMRESGKSFYDRATRFSFRRDFTFPSGIQIWLGNTTLEHGVFKASYAQLPLNNPQRFEIYIFTISCGHLVIQVTSSRWMKKAYRRHANPPKLTHAAIWSTVSTRIWPGSSATIPWPPPVQMQSGVLASFAERWRKLNREI
jgi:hypothetical protein